MRCTSRQAPFYWTQFGARVLATLVLSVHPQLTCTHSLPDGLVFFCVDRADGPFGFMETYDPEYVSNTSDKAGQYAFAQQPEACKWNCQKLAEALSPVVPMAQLQPYLDRFDDLYFAAFSQRMLAKLGLQTTAADDDALLQDLLEVMQQTGADWTVTFRAFCNVPTNALPNAEDDANIAAALRPTIDRIVECCASPQQLATIHMQRSLEVGAASAAPVEAERSEQLRRRAEELGRAPPAAKHKHDVAEQLRILRTWLRGGLQGGQEPHRTALDILGAWDPNRSYEISQTEFRKALHAHGFDAPKDLTQALFDELDSDGTYKLDYKELQAWLDDGS